MESLALRVAIIVLVIMSTGPLALGLSFIPNRGVRIAAMILGSFGVAIGIGFCTLDLPLTGRMIGLGGAAASGVAIWNARRLIQLGETPREF